MRQAINMFIKCASIAHLEFTRDQLLFMQNFLAINFTHSKVDIQLTAVEAFRSLNTTYLATDDQIDGLKESVIEIEKLIPSSAKDMRVDNTRGYNMCFGALSKAMIQRIGPHLLDNVITNSVPKEGA